MTPRIIKPPHLRRGDVIGICAPASPPTPAENVERGIRYLEQLGYRVEVGKNVYRRRGYLAGSDRERADDLNRFFRNPRISAIFTARGGYGAHRILPLLDYAAIRRNPKILVGYSDITAIQLALLAKAGLVSVSGPMVASDMSTGLTGRVEEHFWAMLTSSRIPAMLECDGIPGITAGGRSPADGRLIGGNLSLVSTLPGSDYFPRIHRPIFLLEEIGERPYRIDRMLNQMKLAGIFRGSAGVAFGRFIDCRPESGKPSLSIGRILEQTFEKYRQPVLTGFSYGHISGSLPFPQGIRVRISPSRGTIRFLESAVR